MRIVPFKAKNVDYQQCKDAVLDFDNITPSFFTSIMTVYIE